MFHYFTMMFRGDLCELINFKNGKKNNEENFNKKYSNEKKYPQNQKKTCIKITKMNEQKKRKVRVFFSAPTRYKNKKFLLIYIYAILILFGELCNNHSYLSYLLPSTYTDAYANILTNEQKTEEEENKQNKEINKEKENKVNKDNRNINNHNSDDLLSFSSFASLPLSLSLIPLPIFTLFEQTDLLKNEEKKNEKKEEFNETLLNIETDDKKENEENLIKLDMLSNIDESIIDMTDDNYGEKEFIEILEKELAALKKETVDKRIQSEKEGNNEDDNNEDKIKMLKNLSKIYTKSVALKDEDINLLFSPVSSDSIAYFSAPSSVSSESPEKGENNKTSSSPFLFSSYFSSFFPYFFSSSFPSAATPLSSVSSSFPAASPALTSPFLTRGDLNLRGAGINVQNPLVSSKLYSNVNKEYYDYVVVGGGAVGCPLARTLAEGGFDVLLIERGSNRTRSETPLAMDIYGAGLILNDNKVSQLVSTKNGVRTHIANVMGGGTAINVGIIIDETKEFFETMNERYPEANWDQNLVENSFKWVATRTANPMPEANPYGEAWRSGLEKVGFPPITMDKKRKKQNITKYNVYSETVTNVDFYTKKNSTYQDIDGYSIELQPGFSWRSYSLFNYSRNFYRHASDVLLGALGENGRVNEWDKRPQKLTIKTKHTVHKVLFNTSQSVPEAVCVSYKPTNEADYASIYSQKQTVLGVPLPNSDDILTSIFNPLKSFQKLVKLYRSFFLEPDEQYACIKKEGKIILSAGAIFSPSILFKSGVGPREQLAELGVKPIKELEDLGQHFNDRVFIPVGVFFDHTPPSNGLFPARICQSVGSRTFGPQCENYKIGEKTLKCTFTTAEELSGGRIAEGIIYATRYIIPPEWRDDPLVEYIFTILKECSENKLPFNSVSHVPMCALAAPVVSCFRRVAASFYFTAEPKSRGSVKMKKDGSLVVNANYMQSEQDLFDAVRGVSNIIKLVNSDVYKGIVQPQSINACPVAIMNGFLDIFLQIGAQTRPYVFGEEENFHLIVQHMEDLIPREYKRSRRLLVNDKVVDVNFQNAENLGLSRKLREIFSFDEGDGKNISAVNNIHDGNDNQISSDAILNNNNVNSKMKEESKEKKSIGENANINTCDLTDIYNYVYGCDGEDGENSKEVTSINEAVLDGQIRKTNKTNVSKSAFFFNELKNGFSSEASKDQWAATYPITLPDPNNPVAVAKYVLEYMTSIWHHSGTAQFGKLVDQNFDIIGLKNIAIMDASVLNVVTRMNPTSTLMMMGRYAGLLTLRNRNVSIENLMKN